jgi:hypothetical protein
LYVRLSAAFLDDIGLFISFLLIGLRPSR